MIKASLPSVIWEIRKGISRKIPRFLVPESLRIKNVKNLQSMLHLVKKCFNISQFNKFCLDNTITKRRSKVEKMTIFPLLYICIRMDKILKLCSYNGRSLTWRRSLPSTSAATPCVGASSSCSVELSTAAPALIVVLAFVPCLVASVLVKSIRFAFAISVLIMSSHLHFSQPGLVAFVTLLPPGKAHVPTAETIATTN